MVAHKTCVFGICALASFVGLTRCSWLEDFGITLDYQVYLDEEENFSFHWTILNDTHMEVALACLNMGWCAMGISPNGQMPDSDINFFWYDDTSLNVYLQDRYASSRSVPELDSSQDLELIGASQLNNASYVQYIRKLFSCEEMDNQVELGTTRILYAYHPDDPTEEFFDASSVSRHVAAGSKSVNLLSSSGYDVELPQDAVSYDMTVDNYNVPTSKTTYFCQLFKLPETSATQHIVRFEPIVQTGNEGVVHHMLLYYCPPSFVEEEDVGTSNTCSQYAEMSIGSSDCVYGSPTYSWAIGGEDFSFPSNVGLEMSGTDTADGTELQYVLLEIHYDNPDQLSTFVDSSGMRIWYTPTLREENAGLIEVGHQTSEYHFIAPLIGATVNQGYCGSACLTAGLPDGGVTVFGNMLHAHTAGIALNLRHVRNGVELAPIDQNWNYDFDYQQMVAITDDVQLLPGDDLILDCYYNTSDRDFTTFGGQSTVDEMCLSYVFVYPKPSVRECMSYIQGADLLAWGEVADENGYFDLSDVYNSATGRVNMGNMDYDSTLPGSINWYQQLWQDESTYSGRTQICKDAYDTDLLETESFTVPTITQEYSQDICGTSVGIELSSYNTSNTDETGDDDDDDACVMLNIGWVNAFIVFAMCFFFLGN